MAVVEELMKQDLYQLLEVEDYAPEKAVLKAYRRKALKVHPDKNPSPEAAEQFKRLVEALKILTEPPARAAYDAALRARRARAERLEAQSADRKRARLDLEERERRAATGAGATAGAEERLRREVERLRRQWPDVMEKERERLRHAKENSPMPAESACLKAEWTAADGHGEGWLRQRLAEVGGVANVLMSPVRPGKALIEMTSLAVARAAVARAASGKLHGIRLQWVGKNKERETEAVSEPEADPLPKETVS